MTGTGTPRTFGEWQRNVERSLAESRRGPVQLIGAVREQVEQVEQITVRTPTKPVEVTWQTSLYTAPIGGTPLQQPVALRPVTTARVVFDFPDVTKATDGTDITVQAYELWGYDDTPDILDLTVSATPGLAVPGMVVPGLVHSPANRAAVDYPKTFKLLATSVTSSLREDGLTPGRTYVFKIRAIGEGTIQPGQFTSEYRVTMAADTTPPNQAVAPVVRSDRGQLIVTWVGVTVNGALPADFDHAELAQGPESSPTNVVAQFGRAGGEYIAPDLAYYDVQYFRVRIVDDSGNIGPWSEQAFGYATPLVDTDVILSEIDAAKTHLKNVDAGVSILPNTILTEHLVVTESMSAAIGQFLHLKAGQIDVNDLWADDAFFGSAQALLVRSDMFVGRAFEGGTFTLTQGGTFQTSVLSERGVKIDETGIHAWNPVGLQTYDLQAATGDVVAVGTFWTDFSGTRVRVGDREGIAAVDLWADDTNAHGTIFTLNEGSGIYSTQIAHYPSPLNSVPDSLLQLNSQGWRIQVGDWLATDSYMQATLIQFMLNHEMGQFTFDSSALSLTHNGTGTLTSRPFVKLTKSNRSAQLGTGPHLTLGGADHGIVSIEPTYGYMRVNPGNSMELTDTYWEVDVAATAGTGTGTAHLLMQANNFDLRMKKGHGFLYSSNGNWDIGASVNVDGSGRGRIVGAADAIEFYPTGSGVYNAPHSWGWMRFNQPTQFTGGLTVFGNFTVSSGTKNFLMAHPTKIGRELVHASTESPWSGIEYWGTGTLNEQGFWIVELPDYFEAIAAEDQRLVQVTSPSGAALTWDEIVNGEFMVEGAPGTAFGWHVWARREGYEFEVEPWVGDMRNAGEPRYPERRPDIDHEVREPHPRPIVEDVVVPSPRKPATRKVGDDEGQPRESDRDFGPEDSFGRYQLGRATGNVGGEYR